MPEAGWACGPQTMPQELSGGEQQRVILPAYLTFADVILPTNLRLSSIRIRAQVVKIFRELVDKENVTVVLTTHDIGLMDIADKVYELEDGVLVND